MTALTLTPLQRQSLKGIAHSLNPVVIIGDAGLTPAVLKEIERALAVHELIKVRVAGDDRDARITMYETICGELDAAPVQHIGKLLVIFRPVPERDLPPAKPVARKSAAKSALARPARAGTAARKTAGARGEPRINAISGNTAKPRRNGRVAVAETPVRERPNRTQRVKASGQRSSKKGFQER